MNIILSNKYRIRSKGKTPSQPTNPVQPTFADVFTGKNVLEYAPATREIWFTPDQGFDDGEVNPYSASLVVKALRSLATLDNEAPITLHIMSPGGCVYSGLAVYDAMTTMSNPIMVITHGLVASMGSIILQGGTDRLMMPNSTLMIHSIKSRSSGKPSELETELKETLRLEKIAMEILVKHVDNCDTKVKNYSELNKKGRIAKLKELFHKKGDIYLSPQEAVDLGLADGIIKKI